MSIFSMFGSRAPSPDSFAPTDVLGNAFAPPKTPIEHLQQVLAGSSIEKKQLVQLFNEFYGPGIVQRSNVASLIESLPNSYKLERHHILEFMGRIGNSVTIDDLQDCWKQLRENRMTSQIPFVSGIDPHAIENRFVFQIFDQFSKLSYAYHIYFKKLLDAFHNPLKVLEPDNRMTLWEELQTTAVRDKKHFGYLCYYDSTQKTANRLTPVDNSEVAQKMEAERSEEERIVDKTERLMANPEMRARLIGYTKPEMVHLGMVVPVIRSGSHRIVYYQLREKINEDGLHAYLFTPINRPGCPAQLIFRGTAGPNSTKSDMDGSGVGKDRFDRLSPRIFNMVNQYLGENGEGSVEIMGHSLGACDTQRAAALLIDQVVKAPETLLGRLTGLKIFAYCSPKLDKETYAAWQRNCVIQADKGEKEAAPEIELNFAHNLYDGCTWAGDFNLTGADRMHYLLVKGDRGVLGTWEHHSEPLFTPEGRFNFDKGGRTLTFFEDQVYKQNEERLDQMVAKPENYHAETGSSVVITDEMRSVLRNLEMFERQKAQAMDAHKGLAQHSWSMWTLSQGLRPLKGLSYYAISAIQSVRGFFNPSSSSSSS